MFLAYSEWRKGWERHAGDQPRDTANRLSISRPSQRRSQPDGRQRCIRKQPARMAVALANNLPGLTRLIAICPEALGRWLQVMEGIVASLAKYPDAGQVGQYRPRTVFSLVYRTWGSLRAREIIHLLDQVASTNSYGGLPKKSSTQMYYRIRQEIQPAQADNAPLT